jgi:RES domain
MSSPTWTPAALSSEAIAYEGGCWRLVEAQHRVSTLKLVDSLEEQALLENLVEETKPNIPVECRHLHYLLATPFRYGSIYPTGSRFRRAGKTRGVYYASETVDAAVAEMVFYRLLFFAESPDTPWPKNAAEYTAFSAAVRSVRAIDLTKPPLDRDHGLWTRLVDYAPCQQLADSAREAQLEVIRYQSVRDPERGANIALLSCQAFARSDPFERQTWRIRLNALGAQAICEFPEKRIGFNHGQFLDDPRLASLRRQ